ncbi:hypothetical protein BZA70DRAFT_269543 [Myxozyma melibiosi]|uniref:Uncharacterized protein n=1 Tax=Myxozyma melibiosi TaxID=54550 RepID=A0ABR1EZG8_9ASCO
MSSNSDTTARDDATSISDPVSAPAPEAITSADPAQSTLDDYFKDQADHFRNLAQTDVEVPLMIPLERVPRGIIRAYEKLNPLRDDLVVNTIAFQAGHEHLIPEHIRYSGKLPKDGKPPRLRLYTFFREFLDMADNLSVQYKNSDLKEALRWRLSGDAQFWLFRYSPWRKHPSTTLLDIYRFLALNCPDRGDYDMSLLATNAFQAEGESPYDWVIRLERLADYAPIRKGYEFDIVLHARIRCTSQDLYNKLEEVSRGTDVDALKDVCANLTKPKYLGTGRQFDNSLINNPDGARSYVIPCPDLSRSGTPEDEEEEEEGEVEEEEEEEEEDEEEEEEEEPTSLKRKAREQPTQQPSRAQRTTTAGSSNSRPEPTTRKACRYCIRHNFARPSTHAEKDCWRKDDSKRPKRKRRR